MTTCEEYHAHCPDCDACWDCDEECDLNQDHYEDDPDDDRAY